MPRKSAAPPRRTTVPPERSKSTSAENRAVLSLLAALGDEQDLGALLNRIVGTACRLLSADHGTIGLVDYDLNIVRTKGQYRMPASEVNAEIPMGVGIAGLVLRSGKSVLLKRYGDAPFPTQPAMLEHTVLGMPIVWRGRMIGSFGIGRAPNCGVKPRAFSRADQTTLKTFARYAAIAINTARQYQAEQERSERFALVLRVGRIVTSDLRVDELMQRAADAVHDILGYPNTAIPLVDIADPETLVLNAMGGHYKNLVRGEHRLSVRTGIMGAAVTGRRAILVNDVANDARYIPVPGAKGIVAELAVPILLGEQCLGVLNVESDSRLTARDVETLRIVADQLAIAIDNARLHASARNLAAVEERHRLARDLHDSVTQLLFSMTLVAHSLEPAWRREPEEGARRSARLLELSQQALSEMRALLAELRSAEDATIQLRSAEASRRIALVKERGLFVALRQLTQRLTKDGVHARLRATGAEPADGTISDAVYRITQEALNNVVKHAKAKHVRVSLTIGAKQVNLTVDDDGVGLKTVRNRQGAQSGMGVAFMKERAETLGGVVDVVAAPEKGTRVRASIPLQTGKA